LPKKDRSKPGKGYVYVVNRTIDADLVERVRRGQYEVDAHAVAEAVIRRWNPPGPAPARSLVLVADQTLDDLAVGADEGESEAGRDLA
jgi:hypothetical protein